LSIMGSDFFKGGYQPLVPGNICIEYNNYDKLSLIDENTACVFAELLKAEAGMNVPDKKFIKALRKRCDETGALLVFDEIQTGFGRLGTLFGLEQFGVIPDILLLAKTLGGGLPLGAFIANKNIMSVIANNPPLGHITTFGGHPVCCAAGLAMFEELISSKIYTKVIEKGKLFRKYLTAPAIKEIRGKGLMMAVELGDKDFMHKVLEKGIELGFLTDWFLFCETAFRISPPLTITENEIKEACTLINEAVNTA